MSLSAQIENFLSDKFSDHNGKGFEVSEPEMRTYYRMGKAEQVETVVIQTPYISKGGDKDDKTQIVASILYEKFGRGSSRFPKRLFRVHFAN
jgi:hypothetical protein